MRWTSSRQLACVYLSLSACVATKHEDFTAKYAQACTYAPEPFSLALDGETPINKAARERLVQQVDNESKELMRCYTEALKYARSMHGRVVLKLVIDAQGHVSDARVIDNSTKYGAFACCLKTIVSQFTWPPSAADAARTLAYPMTFELVDMRWHSSVRYSPEPSEFYYTSVKPEGFLFRLDGKMYGDTYDAP